VETILQSPWRALEIIRVLSITDSSQQVRIEWRSKIMAALWYLSTLALGVFGTGVVYATAVEVRHLTRPVPPPAPEVKQDLVIRNVGDGAGRRASFRIMLLTDEFRWRLSSDREVERAGNGIEFGPEMRSILSDAKEIICVGASSEELPSGLRGDEGRAVEERRAARRAERIAEWVGRAVARPIPIRKLNAGWHVPTGHASDTSDQRRVVVILVLEREENTDLDQALRAAMAAEKEKAPIFDTLLTRYSLASRGFAWVD
jgi:hypothetical protein